MQTIFFWVSTVFAMCTIEGENPGHNSCFSAQKPALLHKRKANSVILSLPINFLKTYLQEVLQICKHFHFLLILAQASAFVSTVALPANKPAFALPRINNMISVGVKFKEGSMKVLIFKNTRTLMPSIIFGRKIHSLQVRRVLN